MCTTPRGTNVRAFSGKPRAARSKKARRSDFKVKVMVIVFLNVRGIKGPDNHPAHQQRDRVVFALFRAQEEVKVVAGQLHHDNRLVHNALSMWKFLTEKKLPPPQFVRLP